MRPLHGLTDLQLQIMATVWDRGEATAGEVYDALLEPTGLARKTIGTLLARLEQQGLLTHREEGREFVYRAAVSRAQVSKATVRNVVSRLFEGDLAALVSHALESGEVKAGDVERARELLDAWEDRDQQEQPDAKRARKR
jgi:BlaI family transcriptional regulator, penicillinase repressor